MCFELYSGIKGLSPPKSTKVTVVMLSITVQNIKLFIYSYQNDIFLHNGTNYIHKRAH